MTICLNCAHHNGAAASDSIWSHLCLDPVVEQPREQCPVTGLMLYASRNDLGGVSLGGDKHPPCKDYNHGNCERFLTR